MKKILINIVKILIMILVVISIIFIYRGYMLYQDVVEESSIENRIYELKDNENYLDIIDVNEDYLKLLVESEDNSFYTHSGFDYTATIRAMYINIKTFSFAQGGSTITQQLAKNLCFNFDKKIERKVAEVFVANELESFYEKDEILEYYINIAYYGEGCYGLYEASMYYYGIKPYDLDSIQSLALVYTLKSPTNYNPKVYDVTQNNVFLTEVYYEVFPEE
jgi:membrane peptidoglycan carboxypeptidase